MAYVKGNRLDAQQRVAQIACNDDQVGNAFAPVLATNQPILVTTFDFPNPITATHAARSRAARIASQDSQVGNQLLPAQGPISNQDDWRNPVALNARVDARFRVARDASNRDQIGRAFSPAGIAQATTTGGVITALPSGLIPLRLRPNGLRRVASHVSRLRTHRLVTSCCRCRVLSRARAIGNCRPRLRHAADATT